MTNEEMERAIDFLLKCQANFEARLAQDEASFKAQMDQHHHRIADIDMRLGQFADIEADMMRVMTRTFDAQARINESHKEFKQSISAALTRLAESQANTDRRLDALIDIVRRERNGE